METGRRRENLPGSGAPPQEQGEKWNAMKRAAPESMHPHLSNPLLQQAVSNALKSLKVSPPGPLESHFNNGGYLPIAILAANRPDMLRETLESLLKARGARRGDVLVLQDGDNAGVAQVARSFGIEPVFHMRGHLRVHMDGAERIASHYKWALQHALDSSPSSPGIIVVEDDFLFSPDFIDYFKAVGPLLERDPTTFVVSAWNDNGLKDRVWDKARLCRTGFFPGLGWLLSRRLWTEELASRWPDQHWDHWMRSPAQHKGREAVYPEVNRDYHAGKKGTFMDAHHHDLYFKGIDYNTDPEFRWQLADTAIPSYLFAMQEVYEAYLAAVFTSPGTTHVAALDELEEAVGDVVLWHDTDLDTRREPPDFKRVATYLGIWHEWPRTGHSDGTLHTFRWHGSKALVFLANVNTEQGGRSSWAQYKPSHVTPLHSREFKASAWDPLPVGTVPTAATLPSQSCDYVCSTAGLKCLADGFRGVNTCHALRAHFPCTDCSENYGPEQPAYVVPEAPLESLPGSCLYSSQPGDSNCFASHSSTRRLCPCGPM
uniref:alpha-1,3-mannosyl-glycoprotein 2-beta-N-acetylglucosaminyltransferase n=1 Tax=Octactis speculum TaxID=3111310 RepID=A0A7S2DMU5_9STRA